MAKANTYPNIAVAKLYGETAAGAFGKTAIAAAIATYLATPTRANFMAAFGAETQVLSDFLAADVALNNLSTFFTAVQVAQGTTGVWRVSAGCVCSTSLSAANFFMKLWDGTTVMSAGNITTTVAAGRAFGSLSGIITNPTGNIRLSVQNPGDTSGVIEANRTGSNRDGWMYAERIG